LDRDCCHLLTDKKGELVVYLHGERTLLQRKTGIDGHLNPKKGGEEQFLLKLRREEGDKFLGRKNLGREFAKVLKTKGERRGRRTLKTTLTKESGKGKDRPLLCFTSTEEPCGSMSFTEKGEPIRDVRSRKRVGGGKRKGERGTESLSFAITWQFHRRLEHRAVISRKKKKKTCARV